MQLCFTNAVRTADAPASQSDSTARTLSRRHRRGQTGSLHADRPGAAENAFACCCSTGWLILQLGGGVCSPGRLQWPMPESQRSRCLSARLDSPLAALPGLADGCRVQDLAELLQRSGRLWPAVCASARTTRLLMCLVSANRLQRTRKPSKQPPSLRLDAKQTKIAPGWVLQRVPHCTLACLS